MIGRSPDVWRLRVYAPRAARDNPIQVSRTFRGTRQAAQTELAHLVAEVAEQGAPVTTATTVGELLDKWIDFITPAPRAGGHPGYMSHAVLAGPTRIGFSGARR